MAREGEEKLRLESGARAVAVEVAEKRVLGLIQHHGRIETGSEAIGEKRFAYAGRSLNGNVSKIQGSSLGDNGVSQRRNGENEDERRKDAPGHPRWLINGNVRGWPGASSLR